MELVFKVWKSLCKIDKLKKVKIERFECMLLAGLIWIIANWSIFQVLNDWLFNYVKPEIAIRKSVPSLNCFNTARYTHLIQLTIAVLCLISLSGCIIAL